jgi:MFS transporter, LPLT family, lysophospholipid transporter
VTQRQERRWRSDSRGLSLIAMPRGFVALMIAQSLSALADNAILIIAIALLEARDAPLWTTPFLKFVFIASFVVFAFAVGSFADAMPKARVMLLTNGIKGTGCLLMLAGVHPLMAYALIGFGAAAYSPAKYGLLTELLPASRLVAANAWLEGLTIASVILGTFVGGLLVSAEFAHLVGEPAARTSAALGAAVLTAFVLYIAAATVNLLIPDSGLRYRSASARPRELALVFRNALRTLLRDPAGRVSLLVTTLLWGVGATLQFVVIDWGRERLELPLDRAAMLPGVVVIGVAVGAMLAARWVRLERTFAILPLGLLLGPLVISIIPFQSPAIVGTLLFINGIAAGCFIVPMNAMLQHRGYLLVNAGQAIAVQNFCENFSVMAMLCVYAILRGADVPLVAIVIALGAFMTTAIASIRRHWERDCRESIVKSASFAPNTATRDDP